MTRVFCTTTIWASNKQTTTMLERGVEAQNMSQAQMLCKKWLAFCEESNGDSQDARRPLKNLQNL
eukprot:6993590-Heterocapsa_arctica.AAC.1